MSRGNLISHDSPPVSMPKVIDIQKIIIFTRIALNGFVDWSSGKRNEDEKGVGVGLVINDPLFGFLYRLVVFSRETNDKEGLEADPDLPANLSCHGVGFNCLALVDDLQDFIGPGLNTYTDFNAAGFFHHLKFL